jgi:transcriptional regulator with XRE-family HTH domain
MRKADSRVAKVFGSVLRERRLQAGLTQEALAYEAGIERTYVSFMERGLRQPSLRVVIALSNPLRVSAKELVGDLESRLKK